MTRDDPAAFVPPPAFGPFRVLHQIGIGALGPVFRTYEPTRDRLVAVKVFRLDVTPEQARALADELARASDAGLFHPSIVEPIGAGVEGTVAYRAEEYVAAESLDVAIRHYAPASLDKALPFLTQLAGAIDFARTAGVGHGGLHLRDVFVTPDEARASGFGIVEALERNGLRAPVRRPYSAPERIAGAAWSTPADVFSLAAIAYELLTGRRPSGTGEQIAPLTGPNIGQYADVVRSVLARAMDDDPARRYQTALGFASALDVAARSGAVTDGGIAPGRKTPVAVIVPARPPAAASVPPVATEPIADAAVPPDLEPAETEPAGPLSALPMSVPIDSVDDPPAARVPLADEEAPQEDIVAERDDDAAHHALLRELGEASAPTLFDTGDDDERLADLAIEEPAAIAGPGSWRRDERPAPRVSAEEPEIFHTAAAGRVPHSSIDADHTQMESERPRAAMLPAALGLTVGLLIGFGLGYAVAARDNGPSSGTASAATSTSPASAGSSQSSTPGQGSSSGQPSAPATSGRAWSEQAVTPPTATRSTGEVPPVPGDAPGASSASPPAPAAAPRPTTGRLVVRSTPSGAGVTLNGKWRGRTPLTIDSLQFGPYSVRVVQPGYTAARADVTLSGTDAARTLSIAMQRERSASPAQSRGRAPAPRSPSGRAAADAEPRRPAVTPSRFAGTIYVDSNPRGARVLIDGRSVGTTPASIPDIKIGSHVVRLELPDHRVWTASTRVAAGQETRVTGSLERIR